MHFTITGEFITQHFRTICLEGEWSKALTQLQQSINGFPLENAIQVLSGDYKLTGENEKIFLEEDNDSEEYKSELMDLYGQRIYIHGSWFSPTAVINTINEKSRYREDRARIYDPLYETLYSFNDTTVTLRKSADQNPPIWLESKLRLKPQPEIFLKRTEQCGIVNQTLNDSVTERAKLRAIIKEHSYNGLICQENEINDFLEEDFVREEMQERLRLREIHINRLLPHYYEDLRNEIRAQAKENGGFLTIKALHGEEFTVPKVPFLYWCAQHGDSTYSLYDMLPEWKQISPPGLKMPGDCMYHTDYVIGAGYDPKEFYNNDDFKSAAFGYLHKILKLDMITIHGSGIFKGKALKITEETPIEECKDQIIVIPHAGVEFFEHAKVAELTIAIVGGAASHLAINSEEYDINLVLIEKAANLRGVFTYDLDNNIFFENKGE